MTLEDNRILISKEAWVIRLMQGMVGDYGNQNNNAQIWYNGISFWIKDDNYYKTAEVFDINRASPTTSFWITDEKGIPYDTLNIVNIKEK